MARTPLGPHPQPATRTALFAYFAARLASVPVRGFGEFFDRLGLVVGADGAQRAAAAVRYRSPWKRRAGRRGRAPSEPPSVPPAFREWLLIDELRLDLDLHLVRFPGRGSRQTELLRTLRQLAGVRQVMETADDRAIFAVVITAGAGARRDLRARLEEVTDRMYWHEILFETHEPTMGTWEALAREAALDDGLVAAEE